MNIKYYNSTSQGRILINEMDYSHLKNAIAKLKRTVFYTSDGIIKGENTPEYNTLVIELETRDPKEEFLNNTKFIIAKGE